MKSIRIGNDIRIVWPIVLSGDVSKLKDLDLTVEVRPSKKIIDTHNYADEMPDKDNGKRPAFIKTETTVMMNGGITCRPDIGDGKEHCRPRPCPPHPHRPVPPAPVRLPYHIEDNTLIAMWTADRQFATGDYDIILYAHKNEGGQAVCDQYRFVRLVSHTAEADAPDDSGIEAVIAMQPVTLELSGLSAYEVAVVNGFQGTEEEWLQSLKQPAIDAAEQAKKDLEQFKTETKAEVKQDITNLNSNTGVDDYPVFSASEAYSKGKVVNYNGKLYKFTADHAAGAWTGIDVEETDVVEAHLLEVRADIKLNSIRNIDIVWIDDSYYNSQLDLIQDEINFVSSAVIDVEPNKVYQVNISFRGDMRIGLKDSEGRILKKYSSANDEYYNYSFITPQYGGCKLYLSALTSKRDETILREANLSAVSEYNNIQFGGNTVYDISNIFPTGGDGTGKFNFYEAKNAISALYYRVGTVLKFTNTSGVKEKYIYTGGDVENTSSWIDISKSIDLIYPLLIASHKYYNINLQEVEYTSNLAFCETPILLKANRKYRIVVDKVSNDIYCGIVDANSNIIWKTNKSDVKEFISAVDCYFKASCTLEDTIFILSEPIENVDVKISLGYYDNDGVLQEDDTYISHTISVKTGEIYHIEVNNTGSLYTNLIAYSEKHNKNKEYDITDGVCDILVEEGINRLCINALKGNYISYRKTVSLNEVYRKLSDKEYKEYDLSNAIKHEGQYWNKTLTLQNVPGSNAYEIEVKKGDTYVIDTLLVADLYIGYKVNNIPIKVYRGRDTSVDDFRFKKFTFNFDCTLCITEYNPIKVYKKVETDNLLRSIKDDFAPFINYPSEIIEDKEQGFYNDSGNVDISYMPETYMHSLYKVVHPEGCNIRVYSDAIGVTRSNAGIVYFDADMNVIKTISASSLGIKNPTNTEIDYTENIFGVYYIGISTRSDADSYGILESALLSSSIDSSETNSTPTSNISDLGNLDIAYPEYDYNHIIVYGQSYAQGGGSVANISNVDNTYCLGNTCSANTNKSTAELQVLGNAGGQIAIQCTKSLAMLYNRGRKDKVSFISTNGGASGQQIENISKGSSYYTNLVNEMTRIKQLADAESKSVGCVAIIFIQGESNYISNSGDYTDVKSEYKYLINKLKEDIQNDAISIYGQNSKPLFVTYQTGYKWIRNNNHKMTITQAQVELGLEFDDVILGCPSYQQTINDTQHPNGNGYAWIGELMAKHLYHAFVKYERYDTPHPISFSVKDKIIEIGCYVPVPPLVIDTFTTEEVTNYGFEVLKNGKTVAIKDVSVSGNRIIVTTVENIEDGIVEISYAGLNRNGEGNICDSDNRYSSYQIYVDDTSDTLLKYPVDINGRRIIGKKLPLQNWLCNFYKNIDFHFTKHILIIKTSDVNISNELVNTKDAEVTFSSSNTNIATINQSTGVITPLTNGHSVITASMSINGKTWTDDYLLEID